MSKCEALDQRWYQRIALVVRHPDIITINTSRIGKVNLLDLLPPPTVEGTTKCKRFLKV